jgi:cell division protein FtsA
MDEIFELVDAKIAQAGYAGKLSAGIVLTGGAAAIDGVTDLASDRFGVGARVGSPADNVGGLKDSVESSRYATVVGLALYAAGRLAMGVSGSAGGSRRGRRGGSMDGIVERIKVWLQDFF